MAQELAEIASLLAGAKGLWLTIFGYLIKILWSWNVRPTWPKIIGGLLFCVLIYILIDELVTGQYKHAIFFTTGMLTSNIIGALFRFAKVNEDELMDRTRRWWNSDSTKRGK